MQCVSSLTSNNKSRATFLRAFWARYRKAEESTELPSNFTSPRNGARVALMWDAHEPSIVMVNRPTGFIYQRRSNFGSMMV